MALTTLSDYHFVVAIFAYIFISSQASDVGYTFLSLDGDKSSDKFEVTLERFRRAVNGSTGTTGNDTSTTKPPPANPPTTNPFAGAKVFNEDHQYYRKTVIMDKLIAANYIRAFKEASTLHYKSHQVLSNAHRIALQVRISFDFLFYGHMVKKVTIATGGFLYMSDYLHRYLTYSQYIAPLMADFDTGIGSGEVYYADTGSALYVKWQDVHLKNQPTIGKFTFEAILFKNGTIVFTYPVIPASLTAIKTDSHVVKIGISDAYYKDEDHPTDKNFFTRRILPYNSVNIMKSYITSQTVIILHPLETCVQQPSCSACVKSKTTFNCAWCTEVSRCSSGTDRLKQQWDNKNCHKVNTKSNCPVTAVEAGVIVLIIFIVLILVAALGAFGYWVYYAYSHPATPSGIWLMEHRPSVLASKFAAWRRGGSNQDASDIYRVDSTA